MVREINELGNKYGHLTVIRRALKKERPPGARGVFWWVRCDCEKATEFVLSGSMLRQGYTRTDCGCESRFRILLNKYRRGARERGLSWRLAVAEFRALTKSRCHYCDAPPSSKFTNSVTCKLNPYYLCNGIDRKDNNEGYTPGNSVACCGVCNFMKSNLSHDEFLAQIARIVEYQELMEAECHHAE